MNNIGLESNVRRTSAGGALRDGCMKAGLRDKRVDNTRLRLSQFPNSKNRLDPSCKKNSNAERRSSYLSSVQFMIRKKSI